jgi:hypothetical protein
MKTYISGYYCRDDLHLQIINKDSNRKILEALKEAYPDGLTVEELTKKTKLPMKTIYAQKAELFREYYINHIDEHVDKVKRGRPSAEFRGRSTSEFLRKRVKIVIEDASGLYDPYQEKKPTPLPPGNVAYSDGFTKLWQEIVGTEQEEQLCGYLLQFIQRALNRIEQVDRKSNEKWIPERTIDFCCSQCGLNHEARDFIRAMLLRLIDQFEKYDKFIDFLKDNQMLTQEAHEQIKTRTRNRQ